MSTTYYRPPGSNEITTKSIRLFRSGAREAIEMAGVLLVDGPLGAGKSTEMERFCANITQPAVHVELDNITSRGEILQRLLTALGVQHNPNAKPYALQKLLAATLAGQPWVIIVDEAQRLAVAAMNVLRTLHDRRGATWTLILVGSGVTNRVQRSPELRSRVSGKVPFRSIRVVDLGDVLAKYHDIYKGVPHDLLEAVDKQLRPDYGSGSLRGWALFTGKALKVMDKRGSTTFDAAIATSALTKLLGPVDDTAAA